MAGSNGGRGRSNPRRANGSRRNAISRRLKAGGLPCWICGHPIDPGVPARNPLAFEVDELVPVSRGGDPLNPANCAPAHRCCNEWRAAKPVADVRAVQAAVAAMGGSRSPLEWVAKARAVVRAMRSRLGAAPQVTTDW